MSKAFDTYAEMIRQGNLVAFPTETVYGLGASAWSPVAVQKVFEAKGRPADNPLIVHISSYDMAREFADHIPSRAKLLMQKFWPGPLTIILKKKPRVLDLITAGLDTVALRMPDHPDALELISKAGPMVAPSANKSGRPSPTKADHVRHDFGRAIPVIDGGDCEIGLESTVIDAGVNPPEILRPGFVTADMIEEKCGFRPVILPDSGFQSDTPKSPGMKYTHYAPNARVLWLEAGSASMPGDSLYLMHQKNIPPPPNSRIIHFRGDYKKMARELYDWFRKADHEKIKTIFIEPFTGIEESGENGLIAALKNRISKATGRV